MNFLKDSLLKKAARKMQNDNNFKFALDYALHTNNLEDITKMINDIGIETAAGIRNDFEFDTKDILKLNYYYGYVALEKTMSILKHKLNIDSYDSTSLFNLGNQITSASSIFNAYALNHQC